MRIQRRLMTMLWICCYIYDMWLEFPLADRKWKPGGRLRRPLAPYFCQNVMSGTQPACAQAGCTLERVGLRPPWSSMTGCTDQDSRFLVRLDLAVTKLGTPSPKTGRRRAPVSPVASL